MSSSPIVLMVAALLMASAGASTPYAAEKATVTAISTADDPPSAAAPAAASAATPAAPAANSPAPPPAKPPTTWSTAADDTTRDLEAKLADARARLEQAAHEVAELSARIGKPLMDRFMSFNGEGPPRAVIGVQLDPESGKDGARVQEVSPGGPAAEAGLHRGDVIVAINGMGVKGDEPAREVLHLMRDVVPDSKVKVRVLRDGKQRDFVVVARRGPGFFAMPGPPGPPRPPGPPGEHEFPFGDFPFMPPTMIHGPLGDMELATLTPQLGRYFGTEKGVLVVHAPRKGGLKLEDGDVILAIDGREPISGSHATRILSSYQPGEKIALKLMRDHKAIAVETTLPEGPGPGEDPHRRGQMIQKDEAPT